MCSRPFPHTRPFPTIVRCTPQASPAGHTCSVPRVVSARVPAGRSVGAPFDRSAVSGRRRAPHPGYMSRKIGKFRTDKFDTYVKQAEIKSHVTHVYGWEPAVYMRYTSKNVRLFHVSNFSVRNLPIFQLMYPGCQTR